MKRCAKSILQNKEHWNTIILDGSIPDKDIKLMIAESYDLIADSPTKRIYDAVARIPKGCVATYAQVAGNYAFDGAWKQGEILLSEGVEVKDGVVNRYFQNYKIL